MIQVIPPDLSNEVNKPVLTRIKDLSSHSDNGAKLFESIVPLGDVQVFCSAETMLSCLVVSTQSVIFGLSFGQNAVAFRLDANMKIRALATGGEAWSSCGKDWVVFQVFRPDWPKVDLQFWALKAYVFARETKIAQQDASANIADHVAGSQFRANDKPSL